LSDRQRRLAEFLDANGWQWSDSSPLADDASFRRYRRLKAADRRAVLMDAPPPMEDIRPFARIARHLRTLGLSAPDVLAENDTLGALVLEDLGDDTFTRLLEAGDDEPALYTLAVDVLIHLHRSTAKIGVPNWLDPYDDDRLIDEAVLLTDWYLPEMTGEPTPDATRDAYVAAWKSVFSLIPFTSPTLVLRDFHVDNLMRLEGRTGVAACGILDFQDAVAGSPAYDLMSLVEDARRDIDDTLKSAMIERYLSEFADLDRDRFATAFTILAAQRHAKVIGIFTRLCRRDGKAGYLRHIPRVWRLLEQALEHPALGAVASWFDTCVPRDSRGVPQCRPAAE